MSFRASLAVLCIVLLGSVTSRAQTTSEGTLVEWSEPATMAARSLLLDAAESAGRVIAVGERGHAVVAENGALRADVHGAATAAQPESSPWRQMRVPTRRMLTAIAAVGNDVWAVGHDAVIVHSPDAGQSWTRQHADPDSDTPLLDVWFGDARRGLAVGAYGLALATTDGGAVWQRSDIGSGERHLNAIAAAADGTLCIAAEDGVVLLSRDRGQTWQESPTGYNGSLFGIIPLRNGPIIVFGLRSHVFRSDDQGRSWMQAETGATATLLGGTELPDGTVLIVGLSGTLLVSHDGGRYFHLLNRPGRPALSSTFPLADGRVLLLGEEGARWIDRRDLDG